LNSFNHFLLGQKMKAKRISSTVSALFLAVFMLFSGALPAKAMEFVLISGGTFTMGSPEGEAGRAEVTAFWQKNGIEYSETQHQVKVSEFYMAKYELTVAEFRKFVAATGYRTDAEKGDGSYIWDGTNYVKTAGVNWRHGISGNV
jgi:formylglycine-generating enzyme